MRTDVFVSHKVILITSYKSQMKMINIRPFHLLHICLLLLSCTTQSKVLGQRNRGYCNMEVTELNVVRRLTINYNGAERTVDCTANVNVSECEGSCHSKVSPSVNRFPGFDKECRCCREGGLVSKVITLEECFDGSDYLPNVRPTSWIKEPINCSCQTCRN